jgi:hypothetical protein
VTTFPVGSTPTGGRLSLSPTPTNTIGPFSFPNATRPGGANRTRENPGVVVNSTDIFWRGVAAYFAFGTELVDAGGTGYNYITPQLGFNATPDSPITSFSFRTNLELPGMSKSEAHKFLQPLFDALAAAGVPVTNPTPVTSLSWGSTRKGEGDSPGNGRFGTRIFSRASFAPGANFTRTMAAVRAAVEEGGYTFHGVQVAAGERTQGYPGGSAVNPAFRAGLMHADVFDRSPGRGAARGAAVRAGWARFNSFMDRLREATPGSGAYVNEADAMEPGWQRSFWGAHYGRLLEIKKARDPWGLFYAPTTVGSEFWEVRNGRDDGLPTQDGVLCRVEK